MGRNQDSYVKLTKKVFDKRYPDLFLCGIDCVEKHNLDPSTLSWYPDGYTIFISIKNSFGHNISGIENFLESILGEEIIISIH
jgi:hypothetical protein